MPPVSLSEPYRVRVPEPYAPPPRVVPSFRPVRAGGALGGGRLPLWPVRRAHRLPATVFAVAIVTIAVLAVRSW